MKRCLRCGEEKALEEFPPRIDRGEGAVKPYCRACYTIYHREYYYRDKAGHKKRMRRRDVFLRSLVRAAKDKPCSDCGRRYAFYVMQFDHREGEQKCFSIGRRCNHRTVSKARLLAEIAKCDVVCANCHSERTYQRKLRAAQAKVKLQEATQHPTLL